jgi:hypothetical protein
MESEPGTDFFVLQPLRTEQDYTASVRKQLRRLLPPYLCRQKGSLLVV